MSLSKFLKSQLATQSTAHKVVFSEFLPFWRMLHSLREISCMSLLKFLKKSARCSIYYTQGCLLRNFAIFRACHSHSERSPEYHYRNFSKVSSLLNILHTMTIGLFFQKFCHFGACHSHSEGSSECHYRKFSKNSSLLNLLHTMTTWLSFEKFCRFCGCCTHSGKFSWMNFFFKFFELTFDSHDNDIMAVKSLENSKVTKEVTSKISMQVEFYCSRLFPVS